MNASAGRLRVQLRNFFLIFTALNSLFICFDFASPPPFPQVSFHPPRLISLYPESELTPTFASDLRSAIPRVLHNNQVMFSLCGSGIHAFYNANLFCSLNAVNFSSVLWIGLTRESFEILQGRDCVSILWRENCPTDIFYLTIIKWFISRYLLNFGYEVFYCDTDAVFMGSPDDLVFDGVDIEFTAEIAGPRITRRYPANCVNCGHVKMFPTKATIAFVRAFIEYAYAQRHVFKVKFQHDQTLMNAYIRTIGWQFKGSHFLLRNGLKLGLFDPMLSVTGASVHMQVIRSPMTKEAIRRGIRVPILYHLAYWPAHRKPSALDERNLWFADFPNSLRCRDPPPNGTALFWDNQYNIQSRFGRKFLWEGRVLANGSII
jgi:hypothetical protein